MSSILRTLPFILLGLLCLAALVATVTFLLRQLNLIPPEELSMAAGAPGSAYYETAIAYREILARDDIVLNVIETTGSVANAGLLDDESAVDIALVQGGVSLPEDVVGIASLRMEPIWLLSREPVGADPNSWAGLRIAAGLDGSGTRLVADTLAGITGAEALDRANTQFMDSAEAAAALLSGELDMALFVAPVEAPYLEPLLNDESVFLRTLAHSEAITLSVPGSKLIRIPSGTLDYKRAVPAEDVQLVALPTRLIARDEIHPALVNRLVHAVVEVHSGSAGIPADRRYPASTDLVVQTNDYAAQLLDKGFSPLEAFLPYWIVAQLNRVLLILLPAVFLLLPLMKILPSGYQWVLNRRVFKHYARVHEIDSELSRPGADLNPERIALLMAELDDIERRLLQANLPNIYRKQAYTLLHHVDYVRKRSAHVS